MVKGKYLLISTVIGMAVIHLTGYKNDSVEGVPQLSDTGRGRISYRRAGNFWIVSHWISMRTAYLIM